MIILLLKKLKKKWRKKFKSVSRLPPPVATLLKGDYSIFIHLILQSLPPLGRKINICLNAWECCSQDLFWQRDTTEERRRNGKARAMHHKWLVWRRGSTCPLMTSFSHMNSLIHPANCGHNMSLPQKTLGYWHDARLVGLQRKLCNNHFNRNSQNISLHFQKSTALFFIYKHSFWAHFKFP